MIKTNQVQIYPQAKLVTKKKKKQADLNDDDAKLNETNDLYYGQQYYSKLRPGVADIDPKVQEPYVTIPGCPPRKVVIDRLKKLYSSMVIEDLLQEEGLDFANADPQEDSWLPLEYYDDSTYDCRLSNEWIECGVDGEAQKAIPGFGLYYNREKHVNEWRRILINAYNKEQEL